MLVVDETTGNATTWGIPGFEIRFHDVLLLLLYFTNIY